VFEAERVAEFVDDLLADAVVEDVGSGRSEKPPSLDVWSR